MVKSVISRAPTLLEEPPACQVEDPPKIRARDTIAKTVTLESKNARCKVQEVHYEHAGGPDFEKFPLNLRPEDVATHPMEARVFRLAFQYGVWCGAHLMTLYAMWTMGVCVAGGYWNASTLALHVFIWYWYEQFTFVIIHIMGHASFATRFGTMVKRPERIWYGLWIAWYHHYVDVRKFTKSWLSYRTAYVACLTLLPNWPYIPLYAVTK